MREYHSNSHLEGGGMNGQGVGLELISKEAEVTPIIPERRMFVSFFVCVVSQCSSFCWYSNLITKRSCFCHIPSVTQGPFLCYVTVYVNRGC